MYNRNIQRYRVSILEGSLNNPQKKFVFTHKATCYQNPKHHHLNVSSTLYESEIEFSIDAVSTGSCRYITFIHSNTSYIFKICNFYPKQLSICSIFNEMQSQIFSAHEQGDICRAIDFQQWIYVCSWLKDPRSHLRLQKSTESISKNCVFQTLLLSWSS
jgi:hypothetical protein